MALKLSDFQTAIRDGLRRRDATVVVAEKHLALTTVKAVATDFGFSEEELAAADVVVFSCVTNDAMWSYAGTPTATLGHPLTKITMIISFDGNAKIRALKFVSLSGTSDVTVTLEKYQA